MPVINVKSRNPMVNGFLGGYLTRQPTRFPRVRTRYDGHLDPRRGRKVSTAHGDSFDSRSARVQVYV
jgi:hypothetical protein